MKIKNRLWLSVGMVIFGGCASAPITQQEAKQQAQARFNHEKAKVQYLLAVEQYNSGQIDKARESIRQAAALYLDDPEYYLLLAKILIEEGELAKAGEALATASNLGMNSTEHAYLNGVLSERYHRLEEAVVHYQKALELNPQKISYLMAYAETLVSLNLAEDALQVVDSRMDDFDGDGRLQALCGEILQLLGRPDEAAIAFRKAAIQFPDDELIKESAAWNFFWSGRYSDAIPLFRDLLDQVPPSKSFSIQHTLAECYLQIGDFPTAQAHLQELMRQNPQDPKAWTTQVQVHLGLGDLSAALSAAKRLVHFTPQQSGTHLMLGLVYTRQQDWVSAREVLQAALRIEPNDLTALCLLGQVYEAIGQPSSAVEYYQRALQIDAQDPLALHLYQQLQAISAEHQPSLPNAHQRPALDG